MRPSTAYGTGLNPTASVRFVVTSERPASVLRTIATRPYCWLWIAELVSGTATIALTSALALAVSAQTGNPGLVALIIAAVAVPVLVLSPAVVPVTARLGVHRTLWLSQALMALGAVVLAVCLAQRIGGLVPGFAVVVVIGSANAFHVPALFASLSWFVGEHRVPQGISSFSVRTVLTWILGPIVVAAIGPSHRGAGLAWWGAAALALAAVPTVVLRRRFAVHERALRAQEQVDPGSISRAISDGISDYDLRNVCMLSQAAAPLDKRLRRLLADPPIRFLMCSYGLLYTFLGAYSVVLIPWATKQLGVTAAAATSLVSLRSFSALPGPLVAGRAVRRFGMSATLTAATLIGAAASLVAGLQHSSGPLAIAAVVVYGAIFYVLTSGTYATLTTVVVGAAQRVEGAALFAFVRGTVSILFVLIGLLAHTVGIEEILVSCAIASVVCFLAARVALRHHWDEVMTRFVAGRAASQPA